MPRSHGKDAQLFVDEFNFSGVVMTLGVSIRQSNGEVTAFADADATFVPGKPGWRQNPRGLWSAASPNYDGEMFTDLTSRQRLVGSWPIGATAANRGYEGRSDIGAVPIRSEGNGVIALDVAWEGNDQLVRAHSMYRNTAITATANGSGINAGAIAASEIGVGILRVMSASGTAPTLNVVIASAATDAWPGTSRITFAQATGATFERLTVAGAITDAWWRAQLTVGGTTPSFDVLIAFGIVPGPA